MRVLLTGATGIVGAEIRDQLQRAGAEVTAVARRAGTDSGIVPWDMSNADPPAALAGPWNAIVNCAADTRWSQTADEALRANVVSLEALAPLAAPDTHVVHVSTAAVVGPNSDGSQDDPDAYRNNYEWSKARSERVARERFERLTIVRPPLVIGRRGDGRAARFAGMYMLLRGITSSSVPAVVGIPDGYFDVVPVDDVAAVVVAALDGSGAGEVLTPACGEAAPRVATAVELMCGALNEWREEQGVAPVDVPPFLAPESWRRFYRPFSDDVLSRRQLLTLDHLDNFLPYLELTEPFEPTHPVTNAEEAIAPSVRYWAEWNPRLASLAPRPWAAVAG
ncbi:MAG TPA: SDR family oxidoreductase [Thermoleophilaceae bacterium]|jgi:nucleoside-diphosphate-sugar epimerase